MTMRSRKLPPNVTWHWGDEDERVFNTVKNLLTSPPILAYPDYSMPFELHVDARSRGLGAVLYQTQEDQKRVIAYVSRGLSKSEQNYHAHRLEFLELKWAVTEKFSDYLYGHKFSVYTNNNPLVYILTTAKLDATEHRWVSVLATYDYDFFIALEELMKMLTFYHVYPIRNILRER